MDEGTVITRAIVARFENRFIEDGPLPPKRPELGPCWLWRRPGAGGYGQFHVWGKMRLAHRVAYFLAKGTIPPGLVIDHLCSVTACVRPSHLEAVTQAENLRRANVTGAAAEYARSITHCPDGHEYTEANTVVQNGKRACRKCRNARSRTALAKLRADRRKNGPREPTAAIRTHCRKQHSYAEHGRWDGLTQVCKVCERARAARAYARRRARAQAAGVSIRKLSALKSA